MSPIVQIHLPLLFNAVYSSGDKKYNGIINDINHAPLWKNQNSNAVMLKEHSPKVRVPNNRYITFRGMNIVK